MSKYIYALILAFVCITAAQAQRMLPRQKGLELTAGTLSSKMPGRNYFLSAGLTINGRSGNYWLCALEYNHEYSSYKNLRIPLEAYMAEGGYSLLLLGNARKSITFNAALTLTGGYETINMGVNLLYDGAVIKNEERFVYGAGGRLSLETYLCDRIVLLVQGRARMLWGTSTDQLRPSAGLGLRFNF